MLKNDSICCKKGHPLGSKRAHPGVLKMPGRNTKKALEKHFQISTVEPLNSWERETLSLIERCPDY
jgi:hypothetical protein